MKYLIILALGFMVTWKQFRAAEKSLATFFPGQTEVQVYESDERTFFDEKQQALDFIESKEGDRKFWDFKLYELREITVETKEIKDGWIR